MNELQKVQFELLKEFIRVCEKHNLRYYLNSGTCLGAVRHKGFIPWDDDVDVCLPRDDYDKFLELQYEFEGTPYFIQSWKTDKNYIYNFAKLRNSNTTFIENFYKYHRFNHGVWIDIFPLDGFSKKEKPAKKFRFKVLRTWLNAYLCYPWALMRKFHARTFFRDLILNIFGIIFFWGNVGHYRNKLMDRRMRKINFKDAKLGGLFYGIDPTKEAMPVEIFGEGSIGEFEGIKVVLPKDVDKYLTLLYGDYMTPPPEDKREGHHHNSGYSLTQGYKDYIKEHNQ